MSKTRIEWTEETWNPITGCTKVSPGCNNCYAERQALQLQAAGSPRYVNGFTVTEHPESFDQPLRWKRPRIIFVNSMSDLFHPLVTNNTIHALFDVMEAADHHVFQVLTKRPQRAAEVLATRTLGAHIWIGTSIEADAYAFRANHISRIDTPNRFLSCEPLLGPLPSLDLTSIAWVIVGGESGPGHRPIDKTWVQDIRTQCENSNTLFFFKQWGGTTPTAGGCELDGREWKQTPDFRPPQLAFT